MQNKEIRLASRPAGMPTLDNFSIVDTDVPQTGEVLVRTLYISVDPYLRGRMREGRSYIAPFEVGQVIESGAVGEVIQSRSPKFQPGDIVTGMFGWRLYNAANAGSLMKVPGVPVTTALGVLGIPGLTAYFGLLDIGQPKEGETVVVSGAAGAVGTTVCQIAKIRGCRVVGIAGSDEKIRYLTEELGVDNGINYKSPGGTRDALREACPKGIDVYFDNVGGEVSDAAMPLLNHGARVIICGQISLYNLDRPDLGPRPQPYLLISSALMKGFIVTAYAPRFSEGVKDLAQWLSAGELKYAESIVEGFENTPRAFIGLFSGENLGKQIVKV